MSEKANRLEPMELSYPPKAWITYRKKDGSGEHRGTIATNPRYVKAHGDWLWLPIEIPQDRT